MIYIYSSEWPINLKRFGVEYSPSKITLLDQSTTTANSMYEHACGSYGSLTTWKASLTNFPFRKNCFDTGFGLIEYEIWGNGGETSSFGNLVGLPASSAEDQYDEKRRFSCHSFAIFKITSYLHINIDSKRIKLQSRDSTQIVENSKLFQNLL